MALMVLATMNLGQAVHQKIKLQNTADSAAYSLAAMEARTFNYIAFLNRVQIAHYNTALAIQSLSTWVGYHISVAATSHDILVSLKGAIEVGADICSKCAYKAASPFASLAVNASRKYLDRLLKVYSAFAGHANQYAQAMAVFNKDVIWHAQLVRAGLMNVHLLTGMQAYIQKLDGDLSFLSGKSAMLNKIVNAALNSYEYYSAFDASAGVNAQAVFGLMDYLALLKQSPFPGFLKPKARGGGFSGSKVSDEQAREAYAAMTELTNATRYPSGVTNRSHVIAEASNAFGSYIPGITVVLALGNGKQGQARMTLRSTPQGVTVPVMRTKGFPTNLPEVQLSADDYASSPIGVGHWVMPGYPGYAAAIWYGTKGKVGSAVAAYEKAVERTIYGGTTKSMTYVSYAPSTLMTIPPTVPVPVDVTKIDGGTAGAASAELSAATGGDTNSWPGLAPFFRFRADHDRSWDHGQPSTWIFLNKGHTSFQSDLMKRWGFVWGTQSAELDATIGGKRNSYLFEGLNAIARGQVYYHRPGNWTEHPNFFNPFWRARLAPVGRKLQGFFDRYVGSKVSTTSQDPKAKAIVSGIKNIIGDAFVAVITNLIAH